MFDPWDDWWLRLHSDGKVYNGKWDGILMTQQQILEVLRGEFDRVDAPEA